MNILHLQPELNLTCGITKSIFLITKNLGGEYQQHIITLGGDAINKFENENISVINLELNRNSLKNTIRIFFKIVCFCKRNKINILHSHHRYFDILGYFISLFIPIKTICSIHSKVKGLSILSYKSKKIIAVSQSIKAHLIENFNIPQEKISIINNFVDPNEAIVIQEKKELRAKLKIPEGFYIIGFIGRFSIKEKGIDILLEAFKNLQKDFSNIYLLMVGDGEDKAFINDFIEKNSIPAVIVAAQVHIFDYYNLIDAMVLPSKIDPFPLTMIEAGLMKKPFIGSNVDGISEFIEDNFNGLLFESGNVKILTDKLKILISDNNKSEYLANNLYEKVANFYTIGKILPELNKFYNQSF